MSFGISIKSKISWHFNIFTFLNKSLRKSSNPNCLSDIFCSLMKYNLGGNLGIFFIFFEISLSLNLTN